MVLNLFYILFDFTYLYIWFFIKTIILKMFKLKLIHYYIVFPLYTSLLNMPLRLFQYICSYMPITILVFAVMAYMQMLGKYSCPNESEFYRHSVHTYNLVQAQMQQHQMEQRCYTMYNSGMWSMNSYDKDLVFADRQSSIGPSKSVDKDLGSFEFMSPPLLPPKKNRVWCGCLGSQPGNLISIVHLVIIHHFVYYSIAQVVWDDQNAFLLRPHQQIIIVLIKVGIKFCLLQWRSSGLLIFYWSSGSSLTPGLSHFFAITANLVYK